MMIQNYKVIIPTNNDSWYYIQTLFQSKFYKIIQYKLYKIIQYKIHYKVTIQTQTELKRIKN